jgi:SSS family solute:Na+ symporter
MQLHLQQLDYWAIIIYMSLMAGIGLFFGWFIKDAGAYLKGSGTIPWVVAGVSNFMALFSTFVFVAYAGIAYDDGLVAVTVMLTTVPACIIAAAFLAKRWRRLQLVSPIEYLEVRFNVSVRQIVAWGGIIMRLLDNMVRLYAIGIFLTVVTPLNLSQAIILTGIIVTLFTIVGGLWAVTVMGTVQFVVLIGITLILLPLSLNEVGGISGLQAAIPQNMHWFNGPKGVPTWLLIYCLMVIIKYNENWTFIQRFFCVKDEKSAKKVGYLTAALFFIFPIVFLLPAVAAKVIFPNLDNSEMAYVAVSAKLLPTGLMGVMIASMFAATMSSLTAEYNVIASVLTTDIYKRIFKKQASDKEQLRAAKIFTVITGILVLIGGLYVTKFGGAFEANKLFTGIFAIPIGIPLILGVLLKKPTPTGAIITVFVGAATGIVLNMFPKFLNWEIATLVETIICLVIFISSGYIKVNKEAYQERVKQFFLQLKTPIPEHEKPQIDPKFKTALNGLFAISLGVSGILFLGMSVPSLNLPSGIYSLIAGLICILIGALMWYFSKRTSKA